jgi:hypothetical protein
MKFMMTVKQMERLWDGRKYEPLLSYLLCPRVELALAEELTAAGSLAAAAMGMIRLDELNQTHMPLFGKLMRAVIAAQQNDGGWGEIAISALCLRALSIDDGRGAVIGRGLAYLANLQQPSGIWPRVPIRRMPADAEVSAFVLLQLGEQEAFRLAVEFDEAIRWFEENGDALSATAKNFWAHAKLRCGQHHVAAWAQAWMWS